MMSLQPEKKAMAKRGYIAFADAALATGMNYSSIYRYVHAAKLPYQKVANRWYVQAKALVDLFVKRDGDKSHYVIALRQGLRNLQVCS